MTPVKINQEYDIIIAGGAHLSPTSTYLSSARSEYLTGGCVGCIVASHLAAADPNLCILVLEVGPTTYNDPAHTQLTRSQSNLG